MEIDFPLSFISIISKVQRISRTISVKDRILTVGGNVFIGSSRSRYLTFRVLPGGRRWFLYLMIRVEWNLGIDGDMAGASRWQLAGVDEVILVSNTRFE
jgi:hypothetical protein